MVEDGVLEEGEIQYAVKRLQNNRAGGPSRMQAEDLKGWLVAAKRGEKEREAAVKDGGSRKDEREGAENSARVVELIWRRKPHGRRYSLSPRGKSTTGASASWR